MTFTKQCWCGNNTLIQFSDDYLACTTCGTLVSKVGLSSEQAQVHNDNQDFYGKEYWLSHQTQDHGSPDIYQRSRQDLPERCLYWLRTLLKHQLPPGNVLELGSAHGGFVALARWAGFDAVGMELSPWIVNFAKKAFDVPMLLGMVEEQILQPQSFDAIALYDVLEHLPDPVATMRHCSTLLKPDGIFIVQMPAYPEDKSYKDLVAQQNRFLEMMQPVEHVHLFSRRAAQRLFESIGYSTLQFEPQLFPYDMFFVASRQPLTRYTQEQISDRLLSVPSGRLVQALLDQTDALNQLQALYQELRAVYQMSETDRAARLTVIEQQGQDLANIQGALHQTQTTLHDYQTQLNQAVAYLQETHGQLQQAQTQIKQTQEELERSHDHSQRLEDRLENAKGSLENAKGRLDRARETIKMLRSRMEAMETSKFWKLRKGWFMIKRKLGLKSND